MKVLLMANSIVGLEVARFLKEQKADIVGLGLHEDKLAREADAIRKVFDLPADRVFIGNTLRQPEVIAKIKSWKADIAVSAFWTYIFKDEFISMFPKGVINFHPGYLPFCRGKNPNVWPIVKNCPGGVTLHYVDKGIDTGDIIARRQIPVDAVDTGGSYYDKTLKEIVTLFKETWPKIAKGQAERIPQGSLNEEPSHHFGKDIDAIDEIKLDKTYTGKQLIDILRSRTYDGKYFAYFKDGNDKIAVGIQLQRKKE
jgi:methionyl-tRNA formyltransferase